MCPIDHLNHLLKELGQASGIDLALEGSMCGFETANGVSVAIAPAADGGDVIWLFAEVAKIDPSNRTALLAEAMLRNFFGEGMAGTWLAMDADCRALMLCASRSLLDLTESQFQNLLLNFTDVAENVASTLPIGARSDNANPPPIPPPSTSKHPEFQFGHFA